MLNENIKKYRLANAMSQVEMAQKLGISKQCVSNWENDNVLPSVEMLIRIARLFGVSTDKILGLDDRCFIEVTGLTEKQLVHIQAVINDILKG